VKIDPETRYEDLALYVKDHLEFIYVGDVKWSVAVLVLIIYDAPLLLGFSMLLKIELLWIVLPFVLIIHLWWIRLMIKNPYSTQLEVILFMGVWGALGGISLFITFVWVIFHVLQITSTVFYIIIAIVTIVLVYILVKYQLHKYSGDPIKERKESNQYKYMGLVTASPGIGYLFYVLIEKNTMLEDIISMVSIYYFAIICSYTAAKFLHRYFFMKANMNYVIYQPHGNKKKEKLIKQGVEIK